MKQTLLTFMVLISGLILYSPESSAQSANRNGRSDKKQTRMEIWKDDMAKFRARSQKDKEAEKLVDSLAGVQAEAAIRNNDFVLEANSITFRGGPTTFVSSIKNFISLKGDRAVVQIAPSDYVSGPNGLGGITVEGNVTGKKTRVDRKGNTRLSFNVSGIGINALVEINTFKGTNKASATVTPNFNSNTLWLDGIVVPYEASDVVQGNSL